MAQCRTYELTNLRQLQRVVGGISPWEKRGAVPMNSKTKLLIFIYLYLYPKYHQLFYDLDLYGRNAVGL